MSARVLVVGAGAVGCTLGGWLSRTHPAVAFVARGETAEALRGRGLTLYAAEAPDRRETLRPEVLTSLEGLSDPDLVLLAVKNYGLEAAARQIRGAFGEQVLVVGLQNGAENQEVLPRHFARVVYGIVHYNAWVDAPGLVGYQRKGPLVLAASDPARAEDLRRVALLFAPAVPTLATHRLQDAVHSKLVLNLANSLTTLVAYPQRPLDDVGRFQTLLSRLAREGVAVVRAAGHREFRVPGSPSWLLIRAADLLPRFLTRSAFERNLRKMVLSSMAQDVVRRGAGDTELDSINGRIVALADRYGVPALVNKAVYALCREAFARTPFAPSSVGEIWDAVRPR